MQAPGSSQPPNQQQTQQQTDQAKESQLTVSEAQYLGKRLPPGGRRHKRHEAFHQQHQPDSQPERGAVQADLHGYFLALAGAGTPPRMVLKKSELLGSSTITSLFLEKVAL